jgi:hypothetical protein
MDNDPSSLLSHGNNNNNNNSNSCRRARQVADDDAVLGVAELRRRDAAPAGGALARAHRHDGARVGLQCGQPRVELLGGREARPLAHAPRVGAAPRLGTAGLLRDAVHVVRCALRGVGRG